MAPPIDMLFAGNIIQFRLFRDGKFQSNETIT